MSPSRLEDVLATDVLFTRPTRAPDYKSESEAFRQLAASLASGSAAVLDTFVDAALTLCRAGSAGVSLLRRDDQGRDVFRWVALAGEYAKAGHLGRSMSRTFSPSGICLDLGSPQLFQTPARYFVYLTEVHPPITETLMVPLRYQEQDLGLMWVMSHDTETQFDLEDVRLLEVLGQIAGPTAGHEQQIAQASQEHQEAMDHAAQQLLVREELLSIGSHELRNPLTTVVGFANRLARREDLDAEAQEEIRLVAREANRLRRIIDDFFDLAKLESTAFTLELEEEVDLVELLQEQVTGLRMRHPSVAIDIEFEDTPFVRTDYSRVSQIVTNLLENAVKYGGDAPLITARLRSTTRVHIDVSDRGPGIPLEEQERIFDRAYRLSQRVGSNREGLGLGLYISREIAARLGGSLTVRSAPGEGSTFTLTLPRS